MGKKYIHRTLERELLARAQEFPVIVLTGPRQSGKSTLLQKIFPGHAYISLDMPLMRKQAHDDPSVFLENHPVPVIIDEIQYAPGLLEYIKLRVDKNRENNGAFILTGSQIFPLMQGVSESLAGRAVLFELLGFSMEELLHGKKAFSVRDTFKIIFEGFFPEVCVHKADVNSFYNSYIQTYLERDVRQVKAVHDLNIFQDFLELLASRAGNLLNLNEISKECGISAPSVRNWLSVLEASRMVFLLRPYFRNVSKRVVKRPKIYFTDTGLLSFLLRYPSPDTLSGGPVAGAVFENFVIMELWKHKLNHNRRFELYFYRDSNHNEGDVILDLGYKKVLIEIKKTMTVQEKHFSGLTKIADVLGAGDIFLITNDPQETALSSRVRHIPWWKLSSLWTYIEQE